MLIPADGRFHDPERSYRSLARKQTPLRETRATKPAVS